MRHFVTEMWACVHVSLQNRALWDICWMLCNFRSCEMGLFCSIQLFIPTSKPRKCIKIIQIFICVCWWFSLICDPIKLLYVNTNECGLTKSFSQSIYHAGFSHLDILNSLHAEQACAWVCLIYISSYKSRISSSCVQVTKIYLRFFIEITSICSGDLMIYETK